MQGIGSEIALPSQSVTGGPGAVEGVLCRNMTAHHVLTTQRIMTVTNCRVLTAHHVMTATNCRVLAASTCIIIDKVRDAVTYL